MKICGTLPLLALLGCADLLAPRGAVRFDPDAPDSRGMVTPTRPHFDAIARCTGIRKPFERIEWYLVPRFTFAVLGDRNLAGWWDGDRAIYLSEYGRHDGRTIRHEAMHYLTGPGHPEKWFGKQGACAKELHDPASW